MNIPISWLKDFVDIDLPLDELAHRLTMAGLEVEEVTLIGLPHPNPKAEKRETKISGISWARDKLVVAAIHEVNPHPNADRLTLCRLHDGEREHTVLTGAPNLFDYKGKGELNPPLKVAYAREGATIYDGHQDGFVLTTLKRTKIRGIESYSMVCSEKELGISEEHEGIIFLPEDAPVGMPLADYMGDAVLHIALTPNMARNASVIGVAREIAALTGKPLRLPESPLPTGGNPISGRAHIQITQPELNPRFVLGLLEGVTIAPSPYFVQRRLKLAGMRPINNIVDATNYAMLELGEPLHAFDYDVLVQRAGGAAPTIITRPAAPGETLTTLDNITRKLDDFTVLVCDTAGPLSLAGVMGGLESEVTENTRNVLLEGAAWNLINVRRTVAAQKLNSEAAYRFARGVHPDLAETGVRRCLHLMQQTAGGTLADGLVDAYPLPPQHPQIPLNPADVQRSLGIALAPEEIRAILQPLGFELQSTAEGFLVTPPPTRLDIGANLIGKADLMEEIARIYGYDRIPETRITAELPKQRGNPAIEAEERVRDLLVSLGLQEIITYRLTSPERESRRLTPGTLREDLPYVQLLNPIASDRSVMRHSLLASVLEIVERNARIRPRQALFEIGPVFLASESGVLPEEPLRLVLALSGARAPHGWQPADTAPMDFYDLKGILEGLLNGLHITNIRYDAFPSHSDHPTFHPGKCARLLLGETPIGLFGQLHPRLREQYDLPQSPVLAADLDLRALLNAIPDRFSAQSVSPYPPVYEDLAFVLSENVPAAEVEALIRQTGGKLLTEVRLFDVYRGENIGAGNKSLAYALTYQDAERTLKDDEVAKVRSRIIRRVEQTLNAKLRS